MTLSHKECWLIEHVNQSTIINTKQVICPICEYPLHSDDEPILKTIIVQEANC